uniref:RING-type E3 ubiquitin transferase n=1 Tax=Buteo japonicus TaxID=224669 RepID=A0A8C0BT45_9AVES
GIARGKAASWGTRHPAAGSPRRLFPPGSPLQETSARRQDMATEGEWSCPICCDDQGDIAYVSPCLHRFCLGCALRWVRQKPNCPLCRSGATAILFSVQSEDDFLTWRVPSLGEPTAEDHQDEQGPAGLVPWAQVGSFPPAVWADFFKSHPNNIRPLLPWLRYEVMDPILCQRLFLSVMGVHQSFQSSFAGERKALACPSLLHCSP